jgi:hypothetical protein
MTTKSSAQRGKEPVARRAISLIVVVLLTTMLLSSLQPASGRATAPIPATMERDVHYAASSQGGYLIENRGQVSDEILYYSMGNPAVAFRDDGVMTVVRATEGTRGAAEMTSASPQEQVMRSIGYLIKFDGANKVAPNGRDKLPFGTNFFIGNDPSHWRTNVPGYREVVYPNLYDGVDLIYRVRPDGLKYEFVVRPDADLDRISFTYDGVEAVGFDGAGLVAHTELGDVHDSQPYSYQEGGDGVICGFDARGPLSYGFECIGWDRSNTLIIDPLVYSTFLGGGAGDQGNSIKVDASGNAYVAGYTWSSDFPITPGVIQVIYGRAGDAFVTKLNPNGSALVYSTYIGGAGRDSAAAIALDPSGNVYLTGFTQSSDFPTTPGALDRTRGGACDAFVTKLNAAGSGLIYSTFLGGGDYDRATSLAVDALGNAYVTGNTSSPSFPVTPGAYDTSFAGGWSDVFLTELNPAGSALVFATFLGGSNADGYTSVALALDSSRNIYVTGDTMSTDFPVTAGSFQDVFQGGGFDSFITKVNASGDKLNYSTYLGGSDASDFSTGIVVDSDNATFVTGYTASITFPVTPGSLKTTFVGGLYDAFVTKLNATGATLVYSTFLGSTDDDEAKSIDIVADGSACVTGLTVGSDFPVTPGAFQTTNSTNTDAFLTKLDASGSLLAYSTYLAGFDEDVGFSVTSCSPRTAYVTGYTWSSDFPTTAGVFNETLYGIMDAFVLKIVLANTPPVANASSDFSVPRNQIAFLNGSGSSDADGDILAYEWTQIAGTPTTINDADKAIAWIRPQALGQLKFLLNVTDGFGGWSTDSVLVDVYNLPPNADAGTDFAAYRNVSVALDGSGSSDPNSDPLTFEWNQTAGPNVTINLPNTARPWFVATLLGNYSFVLNVTDTYGAWDTAEVNVTFNNGPPVAVAGPNQTAPRGSIVQLNGSMSYDPDSDPITYGWFRSSGPLVTINNATDAVAWIQPVLQGIYEFTLRVVDSFGAPSLDKTNVTIVGNPPIAVTGPDQVAFRGDVVLLDGSASSDPDGGSLTFLWTQAAGPVVSISNADSALATFVPAALGVHRFVLNITNDVGLWDIAETNVTVVNRPPVADAGPDRNVLKNVLATLDGSGSSDPDGDSLTFSWTQTAGPTASLSGATTPRPTFTPRLSGRYTFELNVSDGVGGSSASTVNLTVANHSPIANAGVDRPVEVGDDTPLDGSASSDPDGDNLIYAWTQAGGPSVTLNGANTPMPRFTPGMAASYVFELSVNDGDGGSSTDWVMITARSTLPPTAVATVWPGFIGYIGTVFVFDGANSTTTNGVISNYSWDFGDGGTAYGAKVTHAYSAKGVSLVTLSVTDSSSLQNSTIMTITIMNRAPTITSETPATATVQVSKGQSQGFVVFAMDPDGDPLNYSWRLDGVDVGSNSSSYDLGDLTVGTHVLNITVSDGSLGDSFQWTISVTAPGLLSEFLWLIVIILVIMSVIVLLIYLRRRRKPEEGTTEAISQDSEEESSPTSKEDDVPPET